jgi:hypothetical protein
MHPIRQNPAARGHKPGVMDRSAAHDAGLTG